MNLEGQVNEWTPEQRQLVFPNTQGRVVRYTHRKYHATRHTFAT